MTPFTSEQVIALEDLAWRIAPTPMVLIGASAVGCYVPMDWRRTEDLDIVVALELDGLDELARRLVGWTRHSRREHEWRSPAGARVDVVRIGRSWRGFWRASRTTRPRRTDGCWHSAR